MIRKQNNLGIIEDLKIALLYTLVSIGLGLCEVIGAMEKSWTNLFYSLMFAYFYSELMATGISMYKKPAYIADKHIRISCLL